MKTFSKALGGKLLGMLIVLNPFLRKGLANIFIIKDDLLLNVLT